MTNPLPQLNSVGLSKTERAHEFVRTRILSSEFAPGHRLVLAEIAKELGVSVVPVREAIRQLEAEGLVTFERNVGARVAMIDSSAYVNSMHTLGVLEGNATALAAPFVTTAQIEHATELNEEMHQCLVDLNPREFTILNRKFHSVLYEACPNSHLVELINSEWDRLNYLRESTFAFVPERAATSVKEHTQLLQLIEIQAEAEYVEKLARAHRLRTIEKYLAKNAHHTEKD
ncbi:GntR family transcriptional regulator [Corynebacterium epidermidicanis]|uniref:Transcriptional regulator, GntR family n=1 Tax=Corynebacterium epidermidicanis TaxID=1050174 RepID=A0A0G3GZH5_9CORY|nr:GntR family transcriptional regulator [Corynebacterium epidermidicanis]AKK04207.1 transcriptional regulator, GntR family [Corynebacterium epidermidicanis]